MSKKIKTTEMNQVKQQLVPKLRFPEFHDVGEWKILTLGNKNISDFIKEKTSSEELKLDRYVSTENILPDFAGVKIAAKLPTTGSFTRFKKGDILISNIRPYLKKVWQTNKDGASSNDVIVIRAQSKISSLFLKFLIKNDEFINYVMEGAKGVKMPRGDVSSIKKYPIAFPDNKEQQKIADCLSSIDDLITAESEKLESIKNHKKGLMQNLFPSEGKTIPNFRFPEFKNDGEWEVKTLGSVCDISNGKSNAQDHEESGTYPLFDRSAEIKKSNKFLFDAEVVVLPGEGMRFIPKYYQGKFDLHQRAYALKDFACNGKFIYFQMDFLQGALASKAVSSTVLSLRLPIIKNFLINIPKDPREQQKIADCLSSVDDLITSQEQKIDALKTHKKGLMQQLFPNINEVLR
jgi:type I restriction enzyme S subunit